MKMSTTIVIVLPEIQSTSLGELTMLTSLVCDRVEPSFCSIQSVGRAIHRGVCVLQQFVMKVQLRTNLDGQMILSTYGVGQKIQPLILV